MAAVTFTAKRGFTLPGNEIGAWLVDTTEETIVGSELVTNGGFGSDVASWDDVGAVASASVSGELRITNTISGGSGKSQTINGLVVGKTYTVSVTSRKGTCESTWLWVDPGAAPASGAYGIDTTESATNTTLKITFVATDTQAAIYLRIYDSASTGVTAFFDNASLRLAVPDFSTEDNGLGVHGSVTKSAVTTGADLVSYSGFSASNYLEQPYNADFDFGTDDWCFGAWITQSPNSSVEHIFSRGSYSGSWSGANIKLYIQADGTLRGSVSDDGEATTDIITSSTVIDDGVPRFVVLQRRGSNIELFIDGTKDAADTVITNAAGTLSNSSATLQWGRQQDTVNPLPLTTGALAMCFAINDSLSASEIKALYNNEKHLFKKHSYYTQSGINYSLDMGQQAATRTANTIKNEQVSLDGKRDALVHRHDYEWSVVSRLIHRTDDSGDMRLSELREFLYSTDGAEVFSYDPYGTVSSPDEPFDVQRLGNQYTENRAGSSSYFNVSFKVQETDHV